MYRLKKKNRQYSTSYIALKNIIGDCKHAYTRAGGCVELGQCYPQLFRNQGEHIISNLAQDGEFCEKISIIQTDQRNKKSQKKGREHKQTWFEEDVNCNICMGKVKKY